MHGKWCEWVWVWVYMCLCTCVCMGQENNWGKSRKLRRKWIRKNLELCPPMDLNLESHACEATVLSLLALTSSSFCAEAKSKLCPKTILPLWRTFPWRLQEDRCRNGTIVVWRGCNRTCPSEAVISDYRLGLFPLHLPLLGESWLVSFPPLFNMLKFSRSSHLTWGPVGCLSSVVAWRPPGGRAHWLSGSVTCASLPGRMHSHCVPSKDTHPGMGGWAMLQLAPAWCLSRPGSRRKRALRQTRMSRSSHLLLYTRSSARCAVNRPLQKDLHKWRL